MGDFMNTAFASLRATSGETTLQPAVIETKPAKMPLSGAITSYFLQIGRVTNIETHIETIAAEAAESVVVTVTRDALTP